MSKGFLPRFIPICGFSSQVHLSSFINFGFILTTWIIVWGVSTKHKYALVSTKNLACVRKANLTQDEAKSLEEISFVFNEWWPIHPWSLFKEGGGDFVLVNQLAIAMLWPTTCNGKTIWNTMPFKLWNNIIINGRLFVFFKQLWTHNWRFLHLGMDKSTTFYLVVFQIQGSMSYNWEFPSLQLLGFCDYGCKFVGWVKKHVPCKQLYYVLQHVMFCGEFEYFIHFPIWNTCDVVQCLLACVIISH